MAEKRVILRYPGGVSVIETDDDFELMQRFIDWIVLSNHFLLHEESENENVFTFLRCSYIRACNIKWRKLCNNS